MPAGLALLTNYVAVGYTRMPGWDVMICDILRTDSLAAASSKHGSACCIMGVRTAGTALVTSTVAIKQAGKHTCTGGRYGGQHTPTDTTLETLASNPIKTSFGTMKQSCNISKHTHTTTSMWQTNQHTYTSKARTIMKRRRTYTYNQQHVADKA